MSELSQAIEEMRNMRESYNDLAKEINEDKKAIIHEMQLAGIDISSDASMAEVAERMREYTVLVKGNNDFVEGTYIRSLGDAMFAGLTSKEATAIETELAIALTGTWMKQSGNQLLKRFSAPNAASISDDFLDGCSELEYMDCPKYNAWGNNTQRNNTANLIYAVANRLTSFASFQAAKVKFLSVWIFGQTDAYGGQFNDLRHLHMRASGIGDPKLSSTGYNQNKLYDLRLGFVRSSNLGLEFYGNVNMAGENLVLLTDYDDPNQPHFANNGEKMLWYFKNHFLYLDDGTPAFADMSETTAPTLTLGANLRDLVMADADVAEYFTSRNWIVA